MDLKIGKLSKCQICNHSPLNKIINLGNITPCDLSFETKTAKKRQKKYPLNLFRCKKCGLVQIDYVVNPKELFHVNYPYRSGITKDLKKFRKNLEPRIKRFK